MPGTHVAPRPVRSVETAPEVRGQLARAEGRPAYKAYQILRVGFTIAPILAGLDKFFHLLTNWDMYLSGTVEKALPFSGHAFMLIVGVIEIAAGVLVAALPRVGAFVVAAWLGGIIINLLLIPGFYDVALRDFGLALGAVALGLLAREFSGPPRKERPVT